MDPTVLTKKLNEETNYIHVNSDHSPSILKQLPMSIEKRLSSLSSSKEIFEEPLKLWIQRKAQLSRSNITKFNYKNETTKKHFMV